MVCTVFTCKKLNLTLVDSFLWKFDLPLCLMKFCVANLQWGISFRRTVYLGRVKDSSNGAHSLGILHSIALLNKSNNENDDNDRYLDLAKCLSFRGIETIFKVEGPGR